MDPKRACCCDLQQSIFCLFSSRVLECPHTEICKLFSLFLCMVLGSEKWTVSCCISKQECHSHQQLQPSSEPVSPQGTQEGEANLLCSSIQTADTLRRALRKGSSGCENRRLAPDRWGAPGRNDFREPGLLHLPLHRKAPNPFPQDIWFFLTIVFWCSDYLPF